MSVSATSSLVMFLQWCVSFALVGGVMWSFFCLAKRVFARPNDVSVMTASLASASVFTLVLALI